jgi:hypothetical protein
MRVFSPAPSAGRTTLLIAMLSLAHLACAPRVARPLESLGDRGGWREVGQAEQGVLYVDTSAVQSIDEGVYRVRTRWRFFRPQREADGATYRASVAVRAVDCRSGRTALLAYVNRDGGRTTHSGAQPLFAAQWDRIHPRSLLERVGRSVCRGVDAGAQLAGITRREEAGPAARP